MIDCSHGNSRKNHARQLDVLKDISKQLASDNTSIIGVMLESNIEEGNQPIPNNLDEIRPGVSVTDACISWESTEAALRLFANSIQGKVSKSS